MLVFELHDNEIDNKEFGTLAAHIGNRGTIDHPYQAEMYLQEALDVEWRRAYLKTAGTIKAIWAKGPDGIIRYLARADSYKGEWVLPFVAAPHARIATGIWGQEACTNDEALAWAAAQLSEGAITAIILERGEIRAAWELVDTVPQLIACGPQRSQ